MFDGDAITLTLILVHIPTLLFNQEHLNALIPYKDMYHKTKEIIKKKLNENGKQRIESFKTLIMLIASYYSDGNVHPCMLKQSLNGDLDKHEMGDLYYALEHWMFLGGGNEWHLPKKLLGVSRGETCRTLQV